MTGKKDVLALEPGPELDVLVAKIVMGWRRMTLREVFPGMFEDGEAEGDIVDRSWRDAEGKSTGECAENPDEYERETLWSPSTDISAAWQVAEKVRGLIELRKVPDGTYTASFNLPGRTSFYQAATAPAAICKAALLAVIGGE